MSTAVSQEVLRDGPDLHREQLLPGPQRAGQQGHCRGSGPRHHQAVRLAYDPCVFNIYRIITYKYSRGCEEINGQITSPSCHDTGFPVIFVIFANFFPFARVNGVPIRCGFGVSVRENLSREHNIASEVTHHENEEKQGKVS